MTLCNGHTSWKTDNNLENNENKITGNTVLFDRLIFGDVHLMQNAFDYNIFGTRWKMKSFTKINVTTLRS